MIFRVPLRRLNFLKPSASLHHLNHTVAPQYHRPHTEGLCSRFSSHIICVRF